MDYGLPAKTSVDPLPQIAPSASVASTQVTQDAPRTWINLVRSSDMPPNNTNRKSCPGETMIMNTMIAFGVLFGLSVIALGVVIILYVFKTTSSSSSAAFHIINDSTIKDSLHQNVETLRDCEQLCQNSECIGIVFEAANRECWTKESAQFIGAVTHLKTNL